MVKAEEWFYLVENFHFDLDISVIKKTKTEGDLYDSGSSAYSEDTLKKTGLENFMFEFQPNVCEICLTQNEIEKFFFEKKKLYIRQVEDDEEESMAPATNGKHLSANDNEICEVIDMAPKKARMDLQESSLGKRQSNNSNRMDSGASSSENLLKVSSSKDQPSISSLSNEYLSSRRSKRSRKNKNDIELTASSYDTVINLKFLVKLK